MGISYKPPHQLIAGPDLPLMFDPVTIYMPLGLICNFRNYDHDLHLGVTLLVSTIYQIVQYSGHPNVLI